MRILIIDDSKFTRTVYESELKQENIQVETAEDGEAGIAKAKSEKPDLVLLDMILPKKDGFDVLRELKADSNTKDIPVIVFSKLNQKSDIDEALKLGAIKYLPKGRYTPKQVLTQIKKILDK